MRVDAYGAISQVYQTNKTANIKRAENVYSQSDKFEISDTAKTYQTAKTAVSGAADVRMDKVDEIKAQMEAGTYNISSEAVADKILSNLGAIVF